MIDHSPDAGNSLGETHHLLLLCRVRHAARQLNDAAANGDVDVVMAKLAETPHRFGHSLGDLLIAGHGWLCRRSRHTHRIHSFCVRDDCAGRLDSAGDKRQGFSTVACQVMDHPQTHHCDHPGSAKNSHGNVLLTVFALIRQGSVPFV
jgi:hypothetical protein